MTSVKLSTKELEAQSQKLLNLASEVQDIYTKAKGAVNLINDSMCAKFSPNMKIKTRGMLQQMLNVKNQLMIAGAIAHKCATEYQNADAIIRKYILDLSDETINTPVSSQIVTTNNETEEYQTDENTNSNWLDLILSFSKSELNNDASKYYDWADKQNDISAHRGQNWCDLFVCWLLHQLGVDFNARGGSGQMDAFKNKGLLHSENSYIPKTGDVVFFDWDRSDDKSVSHVGVIYIVDGEPYIIHGNYKRPDYLVRATPLSTVTNCYGKDCIVGYGDTSSY